MNIKRLKNTVMQRISVMCLEIS